MNLKDKIKNQIKEKQEQLKKLKKAEKKINEENSKKLSEDLSFWNSVNPFYKKRYKSSKEMAGIIFFATSYATLEKEIEELKRLIRGG